MPNSYGQEVSDDGKYVVFQSSRQFPASSGLIIRHNLQDGTENIVTTNAATTDINQPFGMSPDGRFIAFMGLTNNGTGIFRNK